MLTLCYRVYPGLFLVLTIVVTYACIAPILMPFGALFFSVSYLMYKYQLLYTYVNNNQSLGFMWYSAFNRSLISLLFASFTLLALFAINQNQIGTGPFIVCLPLPPGIIYFWYYCHAVFKKSSLVSQVLTTNYLFYSFNICLL